MIVSIDNSQPIELFESLLSKAKSILLEINLKSPDFFINRNDTDFEVDVFKAMKTAAIGTSFENNIELVSGHAFPDISIKYSVYGVEVKKTDKNKWTSTGNSVLESTRIQSIKKIYVFFGKLAKPIDFKFKLYQDCLVDIAVTHSPRYRISMELEKGKTIFDKMKIPYDELRSRKEPLRYFTNYYKTLNKGTEPWWISKSNETDVSPVIRLWSALDNSEETKIQNQIMILFPEVFGNSPTKYNRVIMWLIKKHSVINASLRDEFTAGGQKVIRILKKNITLPKIFYNLNRNINKVYSEMDNMITDNIDEIRDAWNAENIKSDKIKKIWQKKVKGFAIKNKLINEETIGYILKK